MLLLAGCWLALGGLLVLAERRIPGLRARGLVGAGWILGCMSFGLVLLEAQRQKPGEATEVLLLAVGTLAVGAGPWGASLRQMMRFPIPVRKRVQVPMALLAAGPLMCAGVVGVTATGHSQSGYTDATGWILAGAAVGGLLTLVALLHVFHPPRDWWRGAVLPVPLAAMTAAVIAAAGGKPRGSILWAIPAFGFEYFALVACLALLRKAASTESSPGADSASPDPPRRGP